jgi:hypothetical protein
VDLAPAILASACLTAASMRSLKIQALPLPHAPVEGISKLAYLNGELA